MLSAADVNLNALTMDKVTLKFTDALMEKYFKEICSKDAIKYSKLVFYLFLMIFGGYSLGQAILTRDLLYGYSRLGVFMGFALISIIFATDFYKAYYEKIVFMVKIC